MKKPLPENQLRALAPVSQSLPVLQVNIADDNWEEMNKKFRKNLQENLSIDRVNMHVLQSGTFLSTAILASIVPLAVAMGGVGLTILAISAVPYGSVLLLGASEQRNINNKIVQKTQSFECRLREQFREAQLAAYNAQKKQIIEVAEIHLGQGGLLNLEDAAWLANLDPKAIADATHQLAITVLQIRKMLAYERCMDFQGDGAKAVAKPVTFAEMKLIPDFDQHRFFLRKQLAENDPELIEDGLPILQEPEMIDEPEAKIGLFKGLTAFLNPLSGFSLKRKFSNANLPRFKPVEIPGMQPVADFADALASYESRNAPLDLPAVRGWKGGARKSLMRPRVSV